MNSLTLTLLALSAVSLSESACAQNESKKEKKSTDASVAVTANHAVAAAFGEPGTNSGGVDPLVNAAVNFSDNLVDNLNEVKSRARDTYRKDGEAAAIAVYRQGVQGAVDSAVAREHRLGLVWRNMERLQKLQGTLVEIGANASAQKAIYDLFFETMAQISVFDRSVFVVHASASQKVFADPVTLRTELTKYVQSALERGRVALTFGPETAPYARFGSEMIYLASMAAIVEGLAIDLECTGLDPLQKALHNTKNAIDIEISLLAKSVDPGSSVIRINSILQTISKGN